MLLHGHVENLAARGGRQGVGPGGRWPPLKKEGVVVLIDAKGVSWVRECSFFLT